MEPSCHRRMALHPLSALGSPPPPRFARWLASTGERGRGNSQTKIGCTAIAALSEVANLPSAGEHPLGPHVSGARAEHQDPAPGPS